MKLLLIAIAAYQGVNGALMLAAPEFWYSLAPGADHTGPMNIHFIRDIGLAFLASAAALFVAARTGSRAVLIPALVFLGGHALLHLAEMAVHGTTLTAALRDIALIVIPAFLPLAALRGRTAI